MKMNLYEKEHLKRLRVLAPECTVLLRSNGVFPLKETGKLALYGGGARHTIMGGTGSGEVNTRFFVTAEQGLTAAGFTITAGSWLDGYDNVLVDARKRFVEEIKARAKRNDRNAEPGDILLSKTELRDILMLQKKYKAFLLVLNVGSPVDLSPLADVENILILSQLGTDTGHVLADLITGKAYPSGKLTTTWSAWKDYSNIGDFGEENDTVYREGVYVGYRHFDSVGKRALFPFGFGHSYTEFTVSHGTAMAKGEDISVTATVKNTGAYPGKETVQLYVSVPGKKLDSPYQTLAVWQKTQELAPTETTELTLRFRLSQLASFDRRKEQYFLEEGNYILRLGNSSVDTEICGVVHLDADVVTETVRNSCGKVPFEDWSPEKRRETIIPDSTAIIHVKAAAISSKKTDYNQRQTICADVRALSEENLAYINVGAFNPKAGIMGIIGNASTSVAGAAGETTGILKDAGLPTLVMADGPAGLRLSQRYVMDEKGVQSLDETMPQSLLEFMSPLQSKAMRLLSGKKINRTLRFMSNMPRRFPLEQRLRRAGIWSWQRHSGILWVRRWSFLAFTCGLPLRSTFIEMCAVDGTLNIFPKTRWSVADLPLQSRREFSAIRDGA